MSVLPWLESLSADDWDRRPAGRWEGSPGAAPAALAAAEAALGTRFPADYRELMLSSNGGELSGPEESITLERVEDLVERNTEERYEEGFPGMRVIGDNGGGAVYCYDPAGRLGHGEWGVYWVSLGDLAPENARFAGVDLSEVLRRIANGVSFFDEPELGPHTA